MFSSDIRELGFQLLPEHSDKIHRTSHLVVSGRLDLLVQLECNSEYAVLYSSVRVILLYVSFIFQYFIFSS